jgi:hypothetical protein
MFFDDQEQLMRKAGAAEEKREQAPALQNVVIYIGKYITD